MASKRGGEANGNEHDEELQVKKGKLDHDETEHSQGSISEEQVSISSKTHEDGISGPEKEEYEFFFGNDSPFSQWHPCSFVVDEVTYSSAEQYMMHQKAVLFGDAEMAKKILASPNPKTQKSLGRKVKNFDDKIWKKECVEIVKAGNMAKFLQNEKLKEIMIKTYPRTLVEAAPRDRIWGIGLGKSNPKAKHRKTWRGKNLLGFALTDVRINIMKK